MIAYEHPTRSIERKTKHLPLLSAFTFAGASGKMDAFTSATVPASGDAAGALFTISTEGVIRPAIPLYQSTRNRPAAGCGIERRLQTRTTESIWPSWLGICRAYLGIENQESDCWMCMDEPDWPHMTLFKGVHTIYTMNGNMTLIRIKQEERVLPSASINSSPWYWYAFH